MKINENYKNLEESYLFSTIAKKVDEYTKAHPEAKVIKMGIGDVTLADLPESGGCICESSYGAGQGGYVPWIWSGAGI